MPTRSPGSSARRRRSRRSHPNILAILDFGDPDGVVYAVMELLEGETPAREARRRPDPAEAAVDYALQIPNGLAAAHEKGIVHRDLKPENLFVTGTAT